MILIFEQAFAKPRIPQEKWFFFRPRWFFRHVEQGNGRWQNPLDNPWSTR